jgi:hypothetical protein
LGSIDQQVAELDACGLGELDIERLAVLTTGLSKNNQLRPQEIEELLPRRSIAVRLLDTRAE